MKRALLVILVLLIALGGYFWYRGDAKAWLADIRSTLFPKKGNVGLAKTSGGSEGEAAIKTAIASLPYRAALSGINKAPLAKDRVQAWEELSKAYDDGVPGARIDVVEPIQTFVNKYVLSTHMPDDPGIGIRHNVVSGDSMAGIAKTNGTTIEAIKRFNGIKGDVIRPGLSLKVLNQPIAVFVRKSEFKLWVTYGDKLLLVMTCGIGKENRTPPGKFKIVERIKDPVWYPPDGPSIPPGDPDNLLGSRWLGFDDRNGYSGLGIHEATDEAHVGTAASKGCIRLTKKNVEVLFDVVPFNTPVTIFE